MYNIGGLSQIITQAYYSLAKESDSLVFPDGCDALYFQVVHLQLVDFKYFIKRLLLAKEILSSTTGSVTAGRWTSFARWTWIFRSLSCSRRLLSSV